MNISIKSLIWLSPILLHNTYASFSPPQKDSIKKVPPTWASHHQEHHDSHHMSQEDKKKKNENSEAPKWNCPSYKEKKESLEEKDIEKMSEKGRKHYEERKKIFQILERIEEGKSIIAKYDNLASKVLIIGVTGSGKSTLINGLSGKELIYREIEKIVKNGSRVIKKPIKIIDVKGSTHIKIGHKKESETTVPNFSFFNGIYYVDCPGFEDNRGSIEEIINSFFINFLFKGKIKLVLLIPESMLKADKHQDGIGDLIKKLRKILGDLVPYKDSIAIVATKVNQDKDEAKGDIFESLSEYNGIKKDEKDQLTQEEIDMFTDIVDPEPDKEKKSKMHIFPKPSEKGPIDPKDINFIREMVNKDCTFKEVEKVNIAVSSEAMNYVGELNRSLNNNISYTINKICTSIKNDIKNDDFTVRYFQYLTSLANKIDELSSKSDDEEKENEEQGNKLETMPLSAFKYKIQKILVDDIKFFSSEKLKSCLKEHCAEFFTKATFLEFLYKINPDEEKNVKTDKWEKDFGGTKETIQKEFISPIKQKFKRELDKYLEQYQELLEDIAAYKDEVSSRSNKDKNFTEYKEFLDGFDFLVIFLQQNSNKSILGEVLKRINSFAERHGLEGKNGLSKHEDKIISYNSVLEEKGSVYSFEKDLIKSIKNIAAHIQKDFQNDKEKFLVAQKNIFLKAFIGLNKEIEKEHKSIKVNDKRFIKEEEHKEMEKEEQEADPLKISQGIVEAYDQTIKLIKKNKITPKGIIKEIKEKMEEYGLECNVRDVLQEGNHLKNLYKMDPSLKEYKQVTSQQNITAEILHEMSAQIEETHENLKRTHKNLKEDVEIAFKEKTESLVRSFTKEILQYANGPVTQNKAVEKVLKSLISKDLKGKPLNYIIKDMMNEFDRYLSINTLEKMKQNIDMLRHHPKKQTILREDYWTEAIEKIEKGLENCSSKLINLEMSDIIRFIKEKIGERIRFEMTQFKSFNMFIKRLDEIYFSFNNLNKLTKKEYVNELAKGLYEIIYKIDGSKNFKLVEGSGKSMLKKLSGMEEKIHVDPEIRTELFSLKEYVEKERAWYRAWQEKIAKKVFAFDYIYKKLKRETIDNKAFVDFLKMCEMIPEEIEATPKRKKELEEFLELFASGHRTYDYKHIKKEQEESNNKVTVLGTNVSLREVLEEHATESIIVIIALNSVSIDKSIPKERGLLGLSIISPNWYIEEHQTIDLSGCDGTSYSSNESTGKDGKPGEPGASAGNFFGIIQNCHDVHKLTIQASGGNGGRGQDGGDGDNGIDGVNGSDITVSLSPILLTLGFRFTIKSHNADFCDGSCGNWYSEYKNLKNFGSKGSKGGDGGKGGHGGFGGRAGIVKVFEKDNKIINQKTEFPNGTNGKHGDPGKGGKGGRNGDTRHYKVTSKIGARLWEKNGYASDGCTPSEKNGPPEKPASHKKYFHLMVDSSKETFNELANRKNFEKMYNDYPFSSLLIYEQTEDFNDHYVQQSNVGMIDVD